MADPESVTIGGRTYWVCAQCRFPVALFKAWSPCYAVPQPGIPSPDLTLRPQALCTECYHAQFAVIYPYEPLPELVDGKIRDHGPVPHGERRWQLPPNEWEIWLKAVERARASGGAETVPVAHAAITRTLGNGSTGETDPGDTALAMGVFVTEE